MANVICIKWGDKYPSHYVNKLYGMTRRNLTGKLRFVCFTEDPTGIREEVEVKPLGRPDLQGWWHKLWLFSKDFPSVTGVSGPTLFLDLDIVIVDNIDPFFEYYPGRFAICNEWMNQVVKRSNNIPKNSYNSSVFRFIPGSLPHVWSSFVEAGPKALRGYSGDQNWIGEQVRNAVTWPEDWCKSWKWHCAPRQKEKAILPNGSRILVFHGRPNPDEAISGSYAKYPRAEWLSKYWKE